MPETAIPSNPNARRSRRPIAALIALLALGFAARMVWMANAPFPDHFWMDERFTAATVAHPLDRAMEFVAGDVHPPLYYMLLWAWNRVGVAAFGAGSGGGELRDYDLPGIGREGRFTLVGPDGTERSVAGLYPEDWGEWALAPLWFLRLASVAFALATAVLLWMFVRRAYSDRRRLGWIAVAMLLLVPYALTWDTVARSYSMQAALVAALFTTAAFAPQWRRAWIGAVALAIWTALGLLTGYIVLLALPPLAIVIWRFERRPRRWLIHGIGVAVGLLIAAAIWGPRFMEQNALREPSEVGFDAGQSGEFADVLWRMVFSYAVVPYLSPLSKWYWPAFLVYALALGSVLYRLIRPEFRDAILLLALGAGAPLLASAANAIHPGAAPIQARYFYPFAPWFYLLLAYGLDRAIMPWAVRLRRKSASGGTA